MARMAVAYQPVTKLTTKPERRVRYRKVPENVANDVHQSTIATDVAHSIGVRVVFGVLPWASPLGIWELEATVIELRHGREVAKLSYFPARSGQGFHDLGSPNLIKALALASCGKS